MNRQPGSFSSRLALRNSLNGCLGTMSLASGRQLIRWLVDWATVTCENYAARRTNGACA